MHQPVTMIFSVIAEKGREQWNWADLKYWKVPFTLPGEVFSSVHKGTCNVIIRDDTGWGCLLFYFPVKHSFFYFLHLKENPYYTNSIMVCLVYENCIEKDAVCWVSISLPSDSASHLMVVMWVEKTEKEGKSSIRKFSVGKPY